MLLQIALFLLFVFASNQKTVDNIQKGIFQFQAVGCCDPVSTRIKFEEKMAEPPQIILTLRAIEYESGPIAHFTSINEVTESGFMVELTVPKGLLKVIVYEYVVINQDEVEFGFFNIDALGTLRMQQTGDATVPLFMKFKRHFVDEPLVQVFIVGFECETKQVSFEISPFSVAQNGVTLKINKYGPTGLTRLQVSYVATEQSDSLAQMVTHTQTKSATVGYEFAQIKGSDLEKELETSQKVELVQLAGINGLRFMVTPISFIWQGDKIEPTALNVNLRITLDKGNQAVLGLYYFEKKKFRKCPIIYADCGFKGSYVYVCKNIPDFERVFRLAKSVMIPPKSGLVVYQDTSYTGIKTKVKESQECMKDWFEDVPNQQMQDVETLLQLNSFKKLKGQDDVSFVQKNRRNKQEDYWNIQKQSYGIKMPQWYQYNKDGTLEKLQQEGFETAKHFEKIEADNDPNSKDISQEQVNGAILDDIGYDDDDIQLKYQKGQNSYSHNNNDESAMF